MAGVIFVISGPSGVGKGSVVKGVVECFELEARPYLSISVTTRAPRLGEVDGVDYHFWPRERFNAAASQGYFSEWADVFGNLYGTPALSQAILSAEGRDILLEIDVQGALQIQQGHPTAVLVFIDAPHEACRLRLAKRGKDQQDAINRRLEAAPSERALKPKFDHVVVNENLERAIQEVVSIMGRY